MKPLILHGSWILVASAAFATGRWLSPSAALPPADTPVETRQVLTTGDTITRNGKPLTTVSSSASFLDKYDITPASGLSSDNMASAVSESLQESDPVKSSLMFSSLLEHLTADNAQAALEVITSTVSGMESFRYLSLLNYKWGSIDGEAAVAQSREMGGRQGNFSTAIALAGWASQNSDDALKWLEAQGNDDRSRAFWMRGLLSGMADNNPDAATKIVAQIAAENPGSVNRYMETIAREQIKKGFGETERWLNSLNDPKLLQGALGTIGDHLARQDPEKAATWSKKYLGTTGGSHLAGEIADRWVRTNPEDALSWLDSIPSGDAQNRGMREAFTRWSRNNPTDASERLTTMSASPARDNAIRGLASGAGREDPGSIMPWITNISDPQLRQETLIDIGGRWFRQDQKSAAEWIADAGLGVETQDAIVEASQRRGRRNRR